MNMKSKLAGLSLALLFGTASVSAQEYKFVALDNSTETQVCVLAGSDKLSRLKSTITKNGLKRDTVVNGFKCNDMPLSKFAYKYDAHKTVKYVEKFSHKKNRAQTNVNISDLAMQKRSDSSEPIIVYVAANR